jgi:hypothetical protein
LLAQGRWFSPASSTTKTGHHDIAKILLKVALNTKLKKNLLAIVLSFLLQFTDYDYPFGIFKLFVHGFHVVHFI